MTNPIQIPRKIINSAKMNKEIKKLRQIPKARLGIKRRLTSRLLLIIDTLRVALSKG